MDHGPNPSRNKNHNASRSVSSAGCSPAADL